MIREIAQALDRDEIVMVTFGAHDAVRYGQVTDIRLRPTLAGAVCDLDVEVEREDLEPAIYIVSPNYVLGYEVGA